MPEFYGACAKLFDSAKRNITLLLLAATAFPALAAEYSLELKPEDTNIQWTLGSTLHTVHGTFKLTRGKLEFDTVNGAASGQIVVDVPSGASGDAPRDRKMHANVLESAKYPEAIFTVDKIDGTLAIPGTSDVKVDGSLEIHGVAHDATADVHVTATAVQLHALIAFEVPYVAWGMKNPSNFVLKVSKIVRVSINAAGPLKQR